MSGLEIEGTGEVLSVQTPRALMQLLGHPHLGLSGRQGDKPVALRGKSHGVVSSLCSLHNTNVINHVYNGL